MRLFSGRWFWLDVGMLLASVSLASNAASLDFPGQASALKDAFGETRTIRHSKGLVSQQSSQKLPPPSGLPVLPEPATPAETAGQAVGAAEAATNGEKGSQSRGTLADRRRTQFNILSQAKNATSSANDARTRFATIYTSQNAELPTFACEEGQVACPTPNRKNLVQCIAIQALCNSNVDCYGGEDEDPVMCMFYKQIYVDLNAKIKRINSQLRELYRYVDQHRHDSEGHVVRPTV